MTDIEVLDRFATALRHAVCHGPVDSQTIKHAETVLGVTFPRSYRIFLSTFGACYGGMKYELAGLTTDEFQEQAQGCSPQWSSVVRETLRARAASRGNLPLTHISVSDDGMDCQFFIDASRASSDGECPVVALGPGRDNELQATSFAAFVAGEA